MVRLKVHRHDLCRALLKFQFHYGTVKSDQIPDEFDAICKFQFHYGTVKSFEAADVADWVFGFQFHYGTVKRPAHQCVDLRLQCFNSTMVRLKDTGKRNQHSLPAFQFHYGTVKSHRRDRKRLTGNKFQFHYGTVKR